MRDTSERDALKAIYGQLLADIEKINTALLNDAYLILDIPSLEKIREDYRFVTDDVDLKMAVESYYAYLQEYNRYVTTLSKKLSSAFINILNENRELKIDDISTVDLGIIGSYILSGQNLTPEILRNLAIKNRHSFSLNVRLNNPQIEQKFIKCLLEDIFGELAILISTLQDDETTIKIRKLYSTIVKETGKIREGLMKKVKNPKLPWKYIRGGEVIV